MRENRLAKKAAGLGSKEGIRYATALELVTLSTSASAKRRKMEWIGEAEAIVQARFARGERIEKNSVIDLPIHDDLIREIETAARRLLDISGEDGREHYASQH